MKAVIEKMNKTCEKCGGLCCEFLFLPLENFKDEELDLLRVRGVIKHETWIVRAPCPKLKDGKCSIHWRRPKTCKRFKVDGPTCKAARMLVKGKL